MNKQCSTCSAFREHGRGPGLEHECRAKPPIAVVMGAVPNALTKRPEAVIASFWPSVRKENDCREWAPHFERSAI